jgi:hypothetical protein
LRRKPFSQIKRKTEAADQHSVMDRKNSGTEELKNGDKPVARKHHGACENRTLSRVRFRRFRNMFTFHSFFNDKKLERQSNISDVISSNNNNTEQEQSNEITKT